MSWKTQEGEIFECLHEENNLYDVFSLKVWKSKNAQSVVRHLPLDISKITKFILQRGAWVQATVTGKHYRRSPLIQGGLEAPCLATVTMAGSIMNHLLIVRYEKLLGNSISNRTMKKYWDALIRHPWERFRGNQPMYAVWGIVKHKK